MLNVMPHVHTGDGDGDADATVLDMRRRLVSYSAMAKTFLLLHIGLLG